MTVSQLHFKLNNIYYFLFLDDVVDELSSDDDDIAPLPLQQIVQPVQINEPIIGKIKSYINFYSYLF